MNQVATIQPPRLQLPTEAVAMMHLATQLSTARTIPTVFQKSPSDVFNVLAVCMRFGFDFYATVWECSIIKGRLFFSGKMVHAMLNASGHLSERLNFEYSGEGDNRKVTVRGRIQGEMSPRIVEVFVREVRTENENWKRQPDQMLSYSGARVWARRHLPEVLLGLMFEDEAETMKDVTPPRPPQQPIVVQVPDAADQVHIEQPEPPPADAEQKELEPYSLEPPADMHSVEAWRQWSQNFIALVRASSSLDIVNDWVNVNADMLERLKVVEPKMWRMLNNAIGQQQMARGHTP